jgi:hypothetical protein
MARKVLTDGSYYLNPTTKQVIIGKIVPWERLVLITDVTANKVIYNFSDPSLRATAVSTYAENSLTSTITSATGTGSTITFTGTNSFVPGQWVTISGVTPTSFNITGQITAATSTTFSIASTVNGTYSSGGIASIRENTIVTLNYNTATLAATDKLQITIDEFNERITASEELTDPVGKFRTSTPQALIDTDFEYGPQVSKWENLGLINNRPFAYVNNANALTVSDIQTSTAGTKTITVSLTTTTATVNAGNVVGNGTTAIYTTTAAHGFTVGQLVTITGFTTTANNTTSGQPAVILAVPSTTTFIIASAVAANTAATGTGTVTAGVAPAVGTSISVVDTFSSHAVGTYTVLTRASESSFTYSANGSTPTGWASQTIFDPNKTIVAMLPLYTASGISVSTLASSGNLITVTTASPHGLHIGNEISMIGSIASANPPNGTFIVATVTSPTVFTYYVATAPTTLTTAGTFTTTATISAGANTGTVASATNILPGMLITGTGIPVNTYVAGIQGTVITLSQNVTAALSTTTVTLATTVLGRSQSQVSHRAFDGGVIFSTNSGTNNTAQVRQTRRYFRYQSGKGIQISSGTIIKPTYGIDSLTYASGTGLVTVQTKEKHGLQPGYQVTVFGANEGGYNGTFAVTSTTGLNTFTYAPGTAPASATASGNYYVSVSSWNGSVNRLGLFDQQNGVFFEHDGQQLYAVRRSSIFQIAGRVSVTAGSATISQTNTNYPTTFTKQLVPGDFIVLRGQSYKVLDIASDTSLTIQPAYRGATATNVIVSKTIDTRIPQSMWNIDKVDGTGSSGYNLDLTKMQMFYIDYSWYGAGSIRWGFRGPKGNIVYCHKLENNNQNAMAYMRSGNLPGRYECNNQPASTQLTASVAASDTTINVANTLGMYVPVTATVNITAGTSGQSTITVASTTGLSVGMFAPAVTGIGAGALITAINTSTNTLTLSVANSGTVTTGNATFYTYPGTAVIRSGSSWEYVNYTGVTSNTLTGVTRGQAGATGIVTTMAVGSNIATVTSTAGLQVGMRAISAALPDNTKIEAIWSSTVLILSASPTTANPTIYFPAMGVTTGTAGSTSGTTVTTGQAFTYSATAPVVVEQAFPTYYPTMSHWGTSVIMDGRFDDDKSLLFTYGQTTPTLLGGTTTTSVTATGTISTNVLTTSAVTAGQPVPGQLVASGAGIQPGTYVTAVTGVSPTWTVTLSNTLSTAGSGTYTFTGGSTKALMSIRIAPSVDNGFPAAFGSRELMNRMQLQTKALDISLLGASGNVLVQAVLNGNVYNLSSTANTTWTNAVRNAAMTPNSSLAQISDYAGANYQIQGGEVTGGFFTSSTASIDLSTVRDLGNSIYAGGNSYPNNQIYPDGPDTLTIVVTNVGTSAQSVLGRISWTEAQA